jgi:hypothetical protein
MFQIYVLTDKQVFKKDVDCVIVNSHDDFSRYPFPGLYYSDAELSENGISVEILNAAAESLPQLYQRLKNVLSGTRLT